MSPFYQLCSTNSIVIDGHSLHFEFTLQTPFILLLKRS